MNQFDKQHQANIRRYQRRIDAIYKKAAEQAAARAANLPAPDGYIFTFDDFPAVRKQIDALMTTMRADIELTVADGVRAEWDLANAKNDALVDSVLGDAGRLARYHRTHEDALNAFLERKQNGLALSDRVWRYTNQFKDEIEMGLDMGIREGMDAASIARSIQRYLKYPDMLFRRVKDEHGIFQLSQRAAAFHPGQGVYRSSYKNALRLAATETNIAYRSADHERWQDFDFIVGIEVHLSNNHTVENHKKERVPLVDICDELQGRYPKEFKFTGWHPNCRCIAVTITKTKEEVKADMERIRNGEQPSDPSTSENYVKDVPEGFTTWMSDNAERIEGAKSLPYFIRDNFVDGDPTKELRWLADKPKEPTVWDIAEQRHASRTPEREQELRDWWKAREDETRLAKLAADNMLKVAADYGEVDASKLTATLAKVRDLNVLQNETKALAQQVLAMRKQEQALADIIPDVHEWHKQFSLGELKAAHKAVGDTLDKISLWPLEAQKKALEKEILYVADPTYMKPHSIYPTWKVAQDAYSAQLGKVVYQIEVKKIEAELAPIETWIAAHPKAVKVASLYQDAKAAIAAGEGLQSINQKVLLVEKNYKKRIAAQAYRERQKAKASGTNFGDECFTQERRDKAAWNRTAGQANDHFHDNAVEWWKVATEAEKDAMYGYTSGSGYITRPLRGIDGHEWDWFPDQSRSDRHIRLMTSALEKQELKVDTWLKRDSDPWNIDYIFGIDLGKYKSNPSALIGKTGLEDSFQSCGSCRETRFTATGPKDVIMNLYCPKGTKAVYAEPWSAFGDYQRGWNGVTKAHPTSASENEVVLQRGAKLRITKAEYTNGMWYIDVDVIGFDIREFEMASKNGGYYCKFK